MNGHSASRFVGRVGGLAVALGVGAVISLGAPTAWADDATANGPSGSSVPGRGAQAATDPLSKSVAEQPNSPTTDSGTGQAAPDDDVLTDRSPETRPVPSDDSEPTEADDHIAAPGSEDSAADPETADVDDRKAPKHRQPRTTYASARDSSSAKSEHGASAADDQLRDTVPTRAVAAPPDTEVAATGSTPQPSASASVAAVATFERLAYSESKPTTPAVTTKAVASKDPSASQGVQDSLDDDLGSLVAPMILVAAGAARRELGPADTEAVDTIGGQTTSQPYVAAVAAAPTNHAPVITSATANAPGFFFGWVSGKFTATDADKDPLKYAVTTTAKGTVSFNSSTGDFSYAATAAAQHAAAADTATDDDKHDVVTATVTDGKGGVATQPVTVTIRPANNAPTVGFFGLFGVSVGSPNPTTGVVTGKVMASDPDQDTLKYAAPSTTKGTVVVDSATGAFTYTPTVAARRAAAATWAPWSAMSDTFTVTVTDGHGGGTAQAVTVAISPLVMPTGVSMAGGSVKLPEGSQVFAGNGARALVVNDAASATAENPAVDVSLVNTADGKKVGATLTVAGSQQGAPVLTANGARAVVATYSYDDAGGVTRIAVVDTASGAQIGKTLTLVGHQWQVSSAGANVLLTTPDGDGSATRLAMIDTSTVTQVGVQRVVAGSWGTATMNSNYSRAVFINSTQVAVIDTNTLAQVGSTVTLPGDSSWKSMSADNERLVVASNVSDVAANSYSTVVTVVDTVTGTPAAAPLTLAGVPLGPVLIVESSRAVITTGETHDNHTILNTQVTVVDLQSGAQLGATVVLPGNPNYSTVLSADGAGALIATDTGAAAVIDTKTGNQIGRTLTITGRPGTLEFVNAAHTRVLISAEVSSKTMFVAGSFRVSVFDLGTGAQVGSSVVVAGDDYGIVRMSSDGTHALIAVTVVNWWGFLTLTDAYYTTVAVIDTTTGTLTGNTFKLLGVAYDVRSLSPGNTRFLVTTSQWNQLAYAGSTAMTVIDGTTGYQSGGTVTVAGTAAQGPLFSADGTRFVLETSVLQKFGPTSTLVSTVRIA